MDFDVRYEPTGRVVFLRAGLFGRRLVAHVEWRRSCMRDNHDGKAQVPAASTYLREVNLTDLQFGSFTYQRPA